MSATWAQPALANKAPTWAQHSIEVGPLAARAQAGIDLGRFCRVNATR